MVFFKTTFYVLRIKSHYDYMRENKYRTSLMWASLYTYSAINNQRALEGNSWIQQKAADKMFLKVT